MDSKIILKSSTKLSLSDRFAKVQSRSSQPQQQGSGSGSGRDRRSIGGVFSSNPLSVNLKRGVIGSRKPITDTNRLRSGSNVRGGSLASRLQTRPVRNSIQNYVAQNTRAARGGAAVGGRGFQRGARRGGTATRGRVQTNTRGQTEVGNKPTRGGFGKRTQTAAPKKEDLDKDLDSYMSKTRGFLDDQLDDYHKQK